MERETDRQPDRDRDRETERDTDRVLYYTDKHKDLSIREREKQGGGGRWGGVGRRSERKTRRTALTYCDKRHRKTLGLKETRAQRLISRQHFKQH